jgi:hypothetical protein
MNNGYVGRTNGYAEEGDLLVLILDLGMSALLRRELSRNKYRFVGGAYIDGMMKNLDGKGYSADQNIITRWDKFEGKELDKFHLI